MAETKNPGDKTLSVGSKTLSLKPREGAGTVRQSFSHGRTKQVVVETVKRRVIGAAPADIGVGCIARIECAVAWAPMSTAASRGPNHSTNLPGSVPPRPRVRPMGIPGIPTHFGSVVPMV